MASMASLLWAPFRAYAAASRARPLVMAVATAGVQSCAADAIAQLVVEKRDRLDPRRNALFVSFGLLYVGGFQYWLYSIKFVQWNSFFLKFDRTPLGAAPAKALVDQLLHVPALYFPTFYAFKALQEGRPLLGDESSALSRYRTEGWECLKVNWAIWIPAQIFNFTCVPTFLRVPFVSLTSFGWTMILSTLQGTLDDDRTSPATKVTTAA